MSKINLQKKILITFIPLISIFIGFILNEDLSTGGGKLDFYQTFPQVLKFSNLIFTDVHEYTRHFPLHYLILGIPQLIFDDVYITKLFYLFFSLLTPFLIYFNLCKIYPENNENNLLISLIILFIPFFRAMAIWPNAHLTAIIFLLFSNYFYLVYLEKKKFLNIFLNLFFLSLATYSIQSYCVFFIYYLIIYFKGSRKQFWNILILCFIFSIPGLYLITQTPLGSRLDFTGNIPYTILTNATIIFFFISLFLVNIKSLYIIKNDIYNLNYKEIISIILIFLFLVFYFENLTPFIGGGFFYKISLFLFNNELLFFLISLISIFLIYLIFKRDKNLFILILLTCLTSTAYYTSQKYFEPLFLIAILIMSKNFLMKNLIFKRSRIIIFSCVVIFYFLIANLNNYYGLSKNINLT